MKTENLAPKPKKRLSLATQIFIALILALIAGFFLQDNPAAATTYIKPFGMVFLNLVQFIVGPIVLFSFMAGIVSLQDIRKVGVIGGFTIGYYLVTTAVAVSLGLLVSNIFSSSFPILNTSDLHVSLPQRSSILDTLLNIFPSNFLAPITEANMLQLIVVALFLGFAVILIAKKSPGTCQRLIVTINDLNKLFMRVMDMILRLAPLGAFGLLTPIIAENGAKVIGSLVTVLLMAYIGYFLHAAICYSTTVKVLGGMTPYKFFKGMAPAMLFGFSSASSVGTLPLNMKCTEKLGVSKEVNSFVLSLGATLNMDGTAIYQGVCTVFIAACYGIDLNLSQMLTIILTATLASIGTAGVPGAGVVMLAMVLQSVGIPIEGIALVAGIDRLFDMGRTTLNITGDASCAVIVSHRLSKKAA